MVETGTEYDYPMRFTFEGNLYRTNMTAIDLYLSSTHCDYLLCYPEIPIKLPDGRFLRVTYWLESFPPQPGNIEIIENCRA